MLWKEQVVEAGGITAINTAQYLKTAGANGLEVRRDYLLCGIWLEACMKTLIIALSAANPDNRIIVNMSRVMAWSEHYERQPLTPGERAGYLLQFPEIAISVKNGRTQLLCPQAS
jgi:hypothetical protein